MVHLLWQLKALKHLFHKRRNAAPALPDKLSQSQMDQLPLVF
jgi:hypothetical protein